jgi:molybdopterin molybdotransferase
MTGAVVPPGADTVIPFEQADYTDTTMRLSGAASRGANIRQRGEDVGLGDTVLTAGTRLAARHIGAGVAAGRSLWAVIRQPKVAIITTGDELANPPSRPSSDLQPAKIVDSNGPYLVAALTGLGASVSSYTRCADDPTDIERALAEAKEADLILITGGASMGDKDVARAMLQSRGVEFVAVKMQPGKPQGAGLVDGVPVLSLPGNPVSAAVSVAVFVRPLIESLLGTTPPPRVWATVAHGWRSVRGRRQFYPVRLNYDATGQCLIEPVSARGAQSHLVTSLARADALAVVPELVDEVRPGDHLELLALL